MDPAYHIPLKIESLRVIGEICAIQGQIEWVMQNGVRELLKVDQETSLRIMGSTSIANNADIWIRLIRAKQRSKAVLAHANQAYDDIRVLSEGRNDFVHAVYFSKTARDPTGVFIRVHAQQTSKPPPKLAVAMRVRSRKAVSVEKLIEVRDIAAAISVRVAHVHWMTVIRPVTKEDSPWLDRLGELPPLSSPTAEPRLAKAQKRQPRASQELARQAKAAKKEAQRNDPKNRKKGG